MRRNTNKLSFELSSNPETQGQLIRAMNAVSECRAGHIGSYSFIRDLLSQYNQHYYELLRYLQVDRSEIEEWENRYRRWREAIGEKEKNKGNQQR